MQPSTMLPKQAESSRFSGHAKSSAEGLVIWQHLRMPVPRSIDFGKRLIQAPKI